MCYKASADSHERMLIEHCADCLCQSGRVVLIGGRYKFEQVICVVERRQVHVCACTAQSIGCICVLQRRQHL